MQGGESRGAAGSRGGVGLGGPFVPGNLLAMCLPIAVRSTHKINFALSTLFHREWEGSLQAGVLVSKQKESLMWSFRSSSFRSCQDNLQGIGSTQHNWRPKRDMIRKPMQLPISLILHYSGAIQKLTCP
jgi:hypothetical protein